MKPDSEFKLFKASASDIQLLIDYRIIFSLEISGPQPNEAIEQLQKSLCDYFKRAIIENSCMSYFIKCGDEVASIGEMVMRSQPGNFRNPSGRVGYLMNMYTVPKFRGQGLCSIVLNALIQDAKKEGITAFELHSTKAGEGVYIKNGFILHTEPTYRKYSENINNSHLHSQQTSSAARKNGNAE